MRIDTAASMPLYQRLADELSTLDPQRSAGTRRAAALGAAHGDAAPGQRVDGAADAAYAGMLGPGRGSTAVGLFRPAPRTALRGTADQRSAGGSGIRRYQRHGGPGARRGTRSGDRPARHRKSCRRAVPGAPPAADHGVRRTPQARVADDLRLCAGQPRVSPPIEPPLPRMGCRHRRKRIRRHPRLHRSRSARAARRRRAGRYDRARIADLLRHLAGDRDDGTQDHRDPDPPARGNLARGARRCAPPPRSEGGRSDGQRQQSSGQHHARRAQARAGDHARGARHSGDRGRHLRRSAFRAAASAAAEGVREERRRHALLVVLEVARAGAARRLDRAGQVSGRRSSCSSSSTR